MEWEGEWYAGTIADCPEEDTFAVVYEGGDFEAAVPSSAIRLQEVRVPPAVRVPPVELVGS